MDKMKNFLCANSILANMSNVILTIDLTICRKYHYYNPKGIPCDHFINKSIK